MPITLLSSSSQLNRFHPRLRPALASHCGTLAELITRSIHRDVSTVPYRVLLKSYVEFRSRIKKELTRWETAELLKAAEMAMLLGDGGQSPLANIVNAAEDQKRVVAIAHIVNAADSEIDAILLGSVMPHKWLHVRSPFSTQQHTLPLNLVVGQDECPRRSLLMPLVDPDATPEVSAVAQRSSGRIIGPVDRAFAGIELAPLTTFVSSEMQSNIDFVRFARQAASASTSGAAEAHSQRPKVSLTFPFVVPFSTLHQLGTEVRQIRDSKSSSPAVSSSSSNNLSLDAAAKLSSTDVFPAEILRSLLNENIQSTSRYFAYSAGDEEVLSSQQPSWGKRVVWTVLPPTTEFGLICGWRRPRATNAPRPVQQRPAIPSDSLNAILSDSAVRTVFLANALALNQDDERSKNTPSARHHRPQVGILTTQRPKSLADQWSLTHHASTGQPGASSTVVGRLPPSSLEAILSGSVPSVEPSSVALDSRADGHSMVVDNSQATLERKGGAVHRNVSERCSTLGRKLQSKMM